MLISCKIGRPMELLSDYSFNLYYVKGKDLILTDFLSRTPVDVSNPHEIIPISINVKDQLHEHYRKYTGN